MDEQALRGWGIAVSAALIAGALAMALLPPPAAETASAPRAQPAHASAGLAFVVRFRGQGPIARAQALAATGREREAQAQVEAQLLRQRAFEGLCFDRFTAGGVEIVLRTCEAEPANARAALQAYWLSRLRSMRAVDYVDANLGAAPARTD